MIIKLIWAQENSGGIGINNELPWHFKEDLKNFKSITLSSTIIMGRKTWESLKIKPLPKRRNIVLSSNNINEVECYNKVDDLMDNIKEESSIFIIGGAQIYKIFYSIADELHISFVNRNTPNIDVFFPIKMYDIEKKYNKIFSEKLNNEVLYTKWSKITKNNNVQMA